MSAEYTMWLVTKEFQLLTHNSTEEVTDTSNLWDRSNGISSIISILMPEEYSTNMSK